MKSEDFPIKSYENFPQKPIDGFTLYKSRRRWVAVVVLETPYGKTIKLYEWVNRRGEWKVGLANINLSYWDVDLFARKVNELLHRYALKTAKAQQDKRAHGGVKTAEEMLVNKIFGKSRSEGSSGEH
jgi:hypothetical protein